MIDNYARLVQENLNRLYQNLPENLSASLPAQQNGQQFSFKAFGNTCRITPERIDCDGAPYSSIQGILISLYALNACSDQCLATPFKAFKEFPDSMPYVGAFASHTEQVLVPYVDRIKSETETITQALDGDTPPAGTAGDFALMVYPLPKICLCYVFYEADEDFSASVTCLYSNNANRFLPMDALADVGEYTSRKIISLIT